MYDDGNESDISVTMIRNSVVLGQKSFYFFTDDFGENLEEGFLNFVFNITVIAMIFCLKSLSLSLMKKLFTIRKKLFERVFSPKITLVKQGKIRKILDLNKEQAYQAQRLRKLNRDHHFNALNRLKELLRLREFPRHLECFDVAVWQGRSPTASQVVFRDGIPDKGVIVIFTWKQGMREIMTSL